MPRTTQPSIHGVVSMRAELSGPHGRTHCLTLTLEGRGEPPLECDIFLTPDAGIEYAKALVAAINAVPAPTREPAEVED